MQRSSLQAQLSTSTVAPPGTWRPGLLCSSTPAAILARRPSQSSLSGKARGWLRNWTDLDFRVDSATKEWVAWGKLPHIPETQLPHLQKMCDNTRLIIYRVVRTAQMEGATEAGLFYLAFRSEGNETQTQGIIGLRPVGLEEVLLWVSI